MNDLASASLEESCVQNMGATEGGVVCMACGSFFSGKGSFKRHYRDAHYQPGLAFRCPSCKHVYKNRPSFSNHLSLKHKELKGLNLDLCMVMDRDV